MGHPDDAGKIYEAKLVLLEERLSEDYPRTEIEVVLEKMIFELIAMVRNIRWSAKIQLDNQRELQKEYDVLLAQIDFNKRLLGNPLASLSTLDEFREVLDAAARQ